MLLFGHVGITLGAAGVIAGVVTNRSPGETPASAKNTGTDNAIAGKTAGHPAFWLTTLGGYLDIRFLLIGSLLPDIIDKPVGQYLFQETFSNGRIFCHTLIFLILIAASGWYLYRRYHRTGLLALASGTLAHLILDRMWESPKTLLWPLFGLTFERVDLTYWMSRLLQALLLDPVTYIPELVGIAVVAWFVWLLWRRQRIYAFLRHGYVR